MIKIVFIILFTISSISGFVPLIYGAKHLRAFSTQLKALFIYLVAAVATEVSIIILNGLGHNTYMATIQFTFAIIEFLLISYLYWAEFNNPTLRKTVVICVALYFITLITGWFYAANLSGVVDVVDVAEASIFIIMSVIFFFKVLTDLEIPKLTDYPFFWLNSAFLVYFGTAFFLFLFNNASKDFDKAIVYFLTGIHHVVNVAYNILITVAICKARKT